MLLHERAPRSSAGRPQPLFQLAFAFSSCSHCTASCCSASAQTFVCCAPASAVQAKLSCSPCRSSGGRAHDAPAVDIFQRPHARSLHADALNRAAPRGSLGVARVGQRGKCSRLSQTRAGSSLPSCPPLPLDACDLLASLSLSPFRRTLDVVAMFALSSRAVLVAGIAFSSGAQVALAHMVRRALPPSPTRLELTLASPCSLLGQSSLPNPSRRPYPLSSTAARGPTSSAARGACERRADRLLRSLSLHAGCRPCTVSGPTLPTTLATR